MMLRSVAAGIRRVSFADEWPYYLVLLALPALSLAAYGYVLFQIGYIDPWVYTGLIHDYDDVVNRLGPTYYAARIAHIFPNAFLEHLLGDRAGFYAYRYLMLTAAGATVYAFGRRTYSPAVGLVGAVMATATPWLLLSFSSDLYDGTAATYLLMAYVFALTPGDRKIVFHILAGVCAALSAQTVQLTAGVFLMIAPAWLLLHRAYSLRRQALFVVGGVAGFAAAYLALIGLLQLSNPRWAEGDPTLAVIRSLLNGGAAAWSASLSDVFRLEMYYAFAPALIGCALLALLVQSRFREAMRSPCIAYALLTFAPLLFYIWRATERHGVLNLSFTIIYLFPSGVLAGVALAGEVSMRLPARTRMILLMTLSAVLSATWILMDPRIVEWIAVLRAPSYFGFAAVIIAALSAFAALRKPLVTAVSASVLLVYVALSPYQLGEYQALRHHMTSADIDGWDVRRGLYYLMDVVSRQLPLPAHVGFWYPVSPPLTSVQSGYLWGYTRAFREYGMPTIDQGVRDTLKSFSHFVLMAEDEAVLSEGVRHLSDYALSRGFAMELVGEGKYRGDRWGYSYVILQRNPGPIPEPVETAETLAWADLSALVAAGERTKIVGPGRLQIGADVDAPAILAPVPSLPDGSQAVRVRVWLTVTEGSVWIAPAGAGGASIGVAGPATLAAASKEQLIMFDVADASLLENVEVRNAQPGGVSAATIRAIEIARREPGDYLVAPPPDPAAAAAALNEQLKRELVGAVIEGCIENFAVKSTNQLLEPSITGRRQQGRWQELTVTATVATEPATWADLTVTYRQQSGVWGVTSVRAAHCKRAGG